MPLRLTRGRNIDIDRSARKLGSDICNHVHYIGWQAQAGSRPVTAANEAVSYFRLGSLMSFNDRSMPFGLVLMPTFAGTDLLEDVGLKRVERQPQRLKSDSGIPAIEMPPLGSSAIPLRFKADGWVAGAASLATVVSPVHAGTVTGVCPLLPGY